MARRKRNYHAGRDASVVTYGDFGASLDADRDIGTGHFNYYGSPGVWARGDIHGRITAGRNIGHWDHLYGYAYDAAADYDIFSFGRITAVITANNPSGSPVGGRIGSVAAWDEIDGLIQASHSIQLVRSGGPVTATVIAPSIGSIIEHDSTITTAYPYPTTPDSIKPEVLAEAQAGYDEVLAARSGIADDIVDLLAGFAAEKVAALDRLAQEEADVDTQIAETQTAVQESLGDAIDAAQKAGTAASRASAERIHALREVAAEEKKSLEEARDDVTRDADAAYQQALDRRQELLDQLAARDQHMADLAAQDATAAANKRQARQNNWDEYRKNLMTPPPGLPGVDGEPWTPLDRLQFELDLVGLTPGVGNVADLVNAGIYFVRGKLGYASLSLLAATPLIGQTVTVGKWAGKGTKLVDRASDLLRWSDEAADLRKAGHLVAPGAKSPLVQRILAKLNLYPKVMDARTGRHIFFPSGIAGRVPKAQRVPWSKQHRADFIAEWHRRGYPRPKGGWDKYDIHHIRPREFGGLNDFWNLVPVQRGTHQKLFNDFWREFIEL